MPDPDDPAYVLLEARHVDALSASVRSTGQIIARGESIQREQLLVLREINAGVHALRTEMLALRTDVTTLLNVLVYKVSNGKDPAPEGEPTV